MQLCDGDSTMVFPVSEYEGAVYVFLANVNLKGPEWQPSAGVGVVVQCDGKIGGYKVGASTKDGFSLVAAMLPVSHRDACRLVASARIILGMPAVGPIGEA